MAIFTSHFDTPIGEMIAGATDEGICLLDFKYRKHLSVIQDRISNGLNDVFVEGGHSLLEHLRRELDDYFTGNRTEFSVPLQPVGSEFQQKIWTALGGIPYGAVATYMQQAKVYGDEKAIRAVATANGMNGIAILIPCHRVIGTNGSLTGYAGGLPAKRWLLDHERRHSGREMQSSLF
jgi:O-6-methylguanine DNA methyltransferase